QQRSVAGHERRTVHHAGGCDDLVGRIAAHVECPNGPTYVEGERPDVDAIQRATELRVVEIDLDATELRQLTDFPDDDRRDAPRVTREERPLTSGQVTGERVQNDVCVEIQHSSGLRWNGRPP